MTERKIHSKHEVPDHLHAQVIAGQLKLLEGLLEHWAWEVLPDGQLMVVVEMHSYGRTLRVWVKDDLVNIDVACGHVPFNAHMLTWILAQNFGQTFIARAVPPQDNLVPIYLTADYPPGEIEHLAQLIWAGYQASLTWWGRIIRVKTPEEPQQAISA